MKEQVESLLNELMIGKFIICRCKDSGVHAGVLLALDGQTAILRDSHRLWRWQADGPGVALSAVAAHGLAQEGSKVDVLAPDLVVTDMIEGIRCSPKAELSIKSFLLKERVK